MGDSIRQTIEATYSALTSAPEPAATSATPEPAAPEVAVAAPESPPQSAPDLDAASSTIDKPDVPVTSRTDGRDEKGRFAPKAGETSAQPATHPEQGQPAPVKASEAPATTTPTQPQSSPDLRAPQSWKPAAREKWATLPREIQEEAIRVDREVRQTMQETAAARKLATEFQQAIAPYEHLIRAEGSTPLQAISNLMQTAAALRTAPPAHKAQLVGNLIKQFGIPIDALDQYLAGEQPQQGHAPHVDPAQIAQQVEQRIFQQLAQQRQAATQAKAQAEVQAFMASPPEFFEDVRETMADLIDAARNRGVEMSLKAAYDKACLIDDNVRQVLQQREAAKAAQNANASTERAKAAASSVKGQPSVPYKNGKPRSTREALEQSWNELSGR